ncbi:MAG: hypothetical protein KGH94_03040 [Candidatus Micrarchaeota archaeon]|nr:hypothetical protein [Candidatus Micrarchaeota archaeon]
MTTTKTPVMVNGLPGKMATLVANKIRQSDEFELYPYALKGSSEKRDYLNVGGTEVQLFGPDQREAYSLVVRSGRAPPFHKLDGIVVDFTTPKSALENARYYCNNGWNFAMGTTGINPEDARQSVKISGVTALIAPNMARPVVGFMKLNADFANAYPSSLSGCTIKIEESHQAPDPKRPEFKGKRDPSGTAIKLSEAFGKMGIEGCPFDPTDIMAHPEKYREQFVMIRERSYQEKVLGVPPEYLDGHGWHTYLITDNSISKGHNELYKATRDFMERSVAFEGYSKVSNDTAKDGCNVTRVSADGNVILKVELLLVLEEKTKRTVPQLKTVHNVNGRNIYADGTIECIKLIRRQGRSEAGSGKLLSMTDTL